MSEIIAGIRQRNPEGYANYSDQEIADALYQSNPEYQKYNPEEFRRAIDVNAGWGEVFSGVPGRIAGNIQEGVGGTIESIPDAGAAAIENMANGTPTLMDPLVLAGKAIQQLINPEIATGIETDLQGLRPVGKELGEIGRNRRAKNTPANQTFSQEVVGSAMDSVGQMALPILGNILVPGSGAVTAPTMFGGVSGGAKYSESINEGNSPGLAARRGLTAGVLEAGTEAISAGPLFKEGNSLVKKITQYIANEVPGENIAEVGDLYADSFLGGKDLPTGGQVADTALKTTLSTLLSGGTIASIQKGAEVLANKAGKQVSPPQNQPDQVDQNEAETVILRQAAEAALNLDAAKNDPIPDIVGPFKPDTPETNKQNDTAPLPDEILSQEDDANADPTTEPFTETILKQAETLGQVGEEILQEAARRGLTNDQTQEVLNHITNTIAQQQEQNDIAQQQQEEANKLERLVKNVKGGGNQEQTLSDKFAKQVESDSKAKQDTPAFEKPSFNIKLDAEKIVRNSTKQGTGIQTDIEQKPELTDIDGFTNDLPPMRKSKAINALNKEVSRHGKVYTTKDLIKKLINDGYRVKEGKEFNSKAYNKDHDIAGNMWESVSERNKAKARLKGGTNAYTKTVRRLYAPDGSFIDSFNKTSLDYAEYLTDKEQNNETRRKEGDSQTTGKTTAEPGVRSEEHGTRDTGGNKGGRESLRAGDGRRNAVDSGNSQGNELSTDTELAGYQADGNTERHGGRGAGENGLLSGDTRQDNAGRNNFSLKDKPNIELTPAKRRDVNNKAIEILNKQVNEITEADKEILRQYTGSGGLSAKDSADKGDAIFNQHYTDYTTIREMYHALDEAGFKPKRILEPSVGSGNFVGHYPNAQWDVVDIDKTNTDIVKRLYPDAKVFNESYETFKGKNYDLIISNVPFASFSALPREHANIIKPAFKAIHNFFFAHSLDKLKPNGIIAFMTSTGTMDGTGEAKRLREHIIKQADIIGAYRLPMGTQKKNASTDVMIDIIYLQKRPDGANPGKEQIKKNLAFTNVINKNDYPINEYFVRYPDAVLGNLHIGKNKTSMGKMGWIVTGEPDYSKISIKLNDYSAKSKSKPIKTQTEFASSSDAKAYAEKHGLKFSDKTQPFFEDGYFFSNPVSFTNETGGGLFGKKLTGVNAGKMELLAEIDKTHNQNLVEQYKEKYKKAPHSDKSLKTWAKIHKSEKQLNTYLSLFDKDFNLSEIFSEQVRFKDSGKLDVTKDSPLLERAEASEDADGFIRIESEKLIDASETKELLNSGKYALVDDNTMQNSWLYYAGNIYEKLDSLEKISDKQQREKQRKKLESVKPEIIPFKRISVTGKETWLPIEVRDAIGIGRNRDGKWVINNQDLFETPQQDEIYTRFLNDESLVKKDKNETEQEYITRVKSSQQEISNEIIPRIKEVIQDAGLSDFVEEQYNRAKNFFAEPEFDGSSLKDLPKTFRGKPFKLMEHQQKGAERAIYNKKGVIAFAPGLGKTPTAIIVIKQLLQKGVVKKPLFIVPANTIPQWEETARELYPDAKIFEFPRYTRGANKGKPKDWQVMTAEDKEKMVNDLANNRYDYVFISTNLAQKFTIPEAAHERYIDNLVRSISQMEKSDDELTKSQIKAKQQRLAKLRMLKTTMMEAYRKDAESGFDMERLGFDAIVADEVQYYKNIGMQAEDARGGLGANVTLNSVFPKYKNGKPDKTQNPIRVSLQSARSYDFRFKTNYISENNNGNNVFLLTGTPTPNKPLELMTILQHLDVNILRPYRIENVSDFVNEFFEVSEVETTDVSGKQKTVPELTGIKNIDALKKIITRYIDYLPPEAAKDLKRPKQVNVNHPILRNELSERIFEDLQTRILKAVEDSNAKRRGEKIDDIEPIIKLYLAGRDASIDTRLYTPSNKGDILQPGDTTLLQKETREDYSKIAKTVSLVAKRLKEKPDAGQLIFLDRLNFPNGGSTHEEIRNEILAKTNLKPEEVVFVNSQQHVNPATGNVVKSGPKPERLQAIIDEYNAGNIKIVIGNTPKLGVGVDLQKYTTDIYMIDKPYRPDEIEQRINRGVRQGNVNDEVVVHTFNTPGTFDELSDRIVANKQGFNDVFWKNQDSDTAEIATQETPDAYDAAIAIETDPVKRRALEISRDIAQARTKANSIESRISTLARRIKTINKSIKEREESLTRIDNAETPQYENMKGKKRQDAIAEFKRKLSERKARYEKELAELKDDLKSVEKDRNARQDELKEHNAKTDELIEKYVVNGRVSIDAVRADMGSAKKSVSSIKPTGSTVQDVKSWLPKNIAKSGFVEVVQSVKDLPEHLKKTANVLQSVIAWHGSPYDHDKFSLDYIGSGEGAHVYGYGLYFADSKKVAEWYRETLASRHNNKSNTTEAVYYKGEQIPPVSYNNPEKTAAYYIGAYGRGNAKEMLKFDGEEIAVELVDKIKDSDISVKKIGNLYKVELAPEEDEFLLWDKTISEQSDKIKKLIDASDLGENYRNDVTTGERFYRWHASNSSDEEASAYLHSLGIRGIKYLDGFSRDKGKGDYNYVIFDDNDVVIKEKYSKDLSGVEGLYDPRTNKVYLVADMLTKDNINAVVAHELLHARIANDPKLKAELESIESGLRDIFDKISKKKYKGPYKKLYQAAMERVKSAKTQDEDKFEEFLAYSVTQFNKKPESLPEKLRNIIERIIANVKIALKKMGFPVTRLTPADLNALAMQPFIKNRIGKDIQTANKSTKYSKSEGLGIAKSTFHKAMDFANKEKLAVLTRHQLAEVSETILPAIKYQYLKYARKMSAEKNSLHNRTGKIVDKWAKAARKDKKGANDLADMMHDSTMVGVDPSVEYEPIITAKEATKKINIIKNQIRDRPGENQAKRMREIRIIKAKSKLEARRKAAYPILKKRWDALPEWAKTTYQEAKKYHSDHFNAVLQALEDRISESIASDHAKKALMDKLRSRFESIQVESPYFPLSRFGRFWVASKLDGETYFNKFETSKERDKFAEQIEKEGYEITGKGQDLDNFQALDSVSPGFVSDVDSLLAALGDDPVIDNVRDQIYQLYLNALPDISSRKHFIHRKKTPGYNRDALRAFSKKAFHDGSQLATLKYGHKLKNTIDLIRDAIKAAQSKSTYEGFEEELDNEKTKDSRIAYLEEVLSAADKITEHDATDKAVAYVSELQKFYEYDTNPDISSWATKLNAIGFTYFLGGSVAAGIVNTAQTPMVAMPKVAAKFGDLKTIAAFNKAFMQFMIGNRNEDGVVSIETSLIGEELETFNYFVELGIIDKTYSHDLAGVGNEGLDRGSTSYTIMKALSFFFHHAERFNREVTAMAAYRLAREEMTVEQAREYAESVVWHTHFDYDSENRSRIMRGNTARVALQFKQYSQGVSYLYLREMHQALKGADNKVKKEARGTLLRLYLAQAAVTGVTGVFGAGAIEILYEFFKPLFEDDDDPEELEAEMRQWIADRMGKTVSLGIVKGWIDALTGVSVHGRLGLSDVWVRSNDRELEDRAQFNEFMKAVAGPMASVVENIAYVGPGLIKDGEYIRGFEKILPKFAGDALKAVRYSTEGVKNLRGNELVKDYTKLEAAFQAIGFSSARISDRYDENNAIKNIEKKRNNRRADLIERAANEKPGSDEYNEVKAEIKEYNKKVPVNRKIYIGHINKKRLDMKRAHDRSENGITVGKRNKDLFDKYDYAVE